MERDGNTRSLWQDTVRNYPSGQKFPKNIVYDVAVVGGGITGLSLALKLQEKGVRVVLIEAKHIGFGTTGGTTAHINTFLDNPYTSIAKDFTEEKAGMVARAVQDAIHDIHTNVLKYGIKCGLEEKTGYIHARTEEQEAELVNIVEYSRRLGVLAELTETTGLDMDRFRRAARFPGQWQFHPLQYIQGLAMHFEKKGGVLLQDCRMMNMEKDNVCILQTNRGILKASKLVYATHIPPGVNILQTMNAPYRSYAIAVTLEHRGEIPSGLNYDMEEPYHYYRQYHSAGKDLLIIGGADQKTGEEKGQPFLELEAHAREMFPVSKVEYQWSSQYYEPADGLPFIGSLPGEDEDVYVATGYGGNGMIYGPMASLILFDTLTKGSSVYSEVFDAKRIKPGASFSNFIKENAGVAKDLVKDRFSLDKLESLVELAPEEGKVVEYEGKKLGVYKDERGNVFAVDAVCPHMKCMVRWNMMEKSWDCPCHGSRFSYTGEMITGPAKHDLSVVQLQKQASL